MAVFALQINQPCGGPIKNVPDGPLGGAMLSDARWKTITESEFAWEGNALEFLRKHPFLNAHPIEHGAISSLSPTTGKSTKLTP